MSLKFLPSSSAAALVLGVLSLSTPCFAGTLTFGSYGGTAALPGLSNTPILYDNTQTGHPVTTYTGGTSTSYASTVYTTPPTIAGTATVSYDPNTFTNAQGGDNGGLTVYTTSYTGNLAGASGSISLLADDSVTAYLNGFLLGSTSATPYDTLNTFNIVAGDYKNGLNVFTFNVINANSPTTNGGPTTLDFQATAVTPEPSSMLMLGTGLLSVAGAMRRKLLS